MPCCPTTGFSGRSAARPAAEPRRSTDRASSLMCGPIGMVLLTALMGLSASCARNAVPSGRQPGRVVSEADFDAIPLELDRVHLRGLGINLADIEFPVLINRPRVEFPEGEPRRGGDVQLRCVIEIDGRVDRCKVQRTASPKFSAAAMAAVTRRKYTPCRVKDQPTPAYVDIKVQFRSRW